MLSLWLPVFRACGYIVRQMKYILALLSYLSTKPLKLKQNSLFGWVRRITACLTVHVPAKWNVIGLRICGTREVSGWPKPPNVMESPPSSGVCKNPSEQLSVDMPVFRHTLKKVSHSLRITGLQISQQSLFASKDCGLLTEMSSSSTRPRSPLYKEHGIKKSQRRCHTNTYMYIQERHLTCLADACTYFY